ncbi:MAG TPA: gluconate 2-dehydrogenase subunit 3 family protein [Saprospiraceae bacterium]|nr:gluconate 2-dehydrogenase subunit 3 family protein [Saprospiraceae bacterium]
MGLPQDRRTFLKKISAFGVVAHLPTWYACSTDAHNYPFRVITTKQQSILKVVITILFPTTDTLKINQLQTVPFIDFILSDENYDADEKNTLLDGITSLENLTKEKFNKSFIDLSIRNQEKLIVYIKDKSWGEFWLSRLLTIVFESLLLDPIYQINKNGIGWNWLAHKSGVPRPDKNNKYQEILKRKKENVLISNLSDL